MAEANENSREEQKEKAVAPENAENKKAASGSGDSSAKPDNESSTENGGEDTGSQEPSDPPWLAELDVYPLRDKSEDPRWALRIVYVWIGFALASITFILTLLILGAMHD